jgi:hypothetical protein
VPGRRHCGEELRHFSASGSRTRAPVLYPARRAPTPP